MATKGKTKEAIKSADEYMHSDKNKEVNALINKIKEPVHKDLILKRIMMNQLEILELMKK